MLNMNKSAYRKGFFRNQQLLLKDERKLNVPNDDTIDESHFVYLRDANRLKLFDCNKTALRLR